MRFGEIGLEADRFPVTCLGSRRAPKGLESHTEIIVRLRIAWFEADRLPVTGFRSPSNVQECEECYRDLDVLE